MNYESETFCEALQAFVQESGLTMGRLAMCLLMTRVDVLELASGLRKPTLADLERLETIAAFKSDPTWQKRIFTAYLRDRYGAARVATLLDTPRVDTSQALPLVNVAGGCDR
jgi:hypothetical protein